MFILTPFHKKYKLWVPLHHQLGLARHHFLIHNALLRTDRLTGHVTRNISIPAQSCNYPTNQSRGSILSCRYTPRVSVNIYIRKWNKCYVHGLGMIVGASQVFPIVNSSFRELLTLVDYIIEGAGYVTRLSMFG